MSNYWLTKIGRNRAVEMSVKVCGRTNVGGRSLACV